MAKVTNSDSKGNFPRKQRFRKLKQGKTEAPATKKVMPLENEMPYASSKDKIKAFLTDAFMLSLPILYVVFYLVMDGREDFAQHKLLGWGYFLIPLVIVQTIFMHKSGQTPGYRAYHLTLIDVKTKKKPTLFVILFRNLCAILSMLTLLGWALMFFRKDHKTLHDLLSATALVKTHDPSR